MIEFIARVATAVVIFCLSVLTEQVPFDPTWRASAFIGLVGVLGLLLDKRDLKNAGSAGLLAVADSLALAVVLASAGQLESFGFVVLAPCAYAAARYGSLPSAMAPIAASTLLIAETTLGTTLPSNALLGQALGILVIGLLMNHRRIIVTVTRDVIGAVDPMNIAEPDAYLALRENFRKLKDLHRDLELATKRDRLAMQLIETSYPTGERFMPRLAERLLELTRVQSLTLFSVAQYANRMVVSATAGEVPSQILDSALDFELKGSTEQIANKFDSKILSLLPDGQRPPLANVALSVGGRVLGLVCLSDEDPTRLHQACIDIQEMSEMIAAMIEEEKRRARIARRLAETDILYGVAVCAQGSTTVNSLSDRVLREMFEEMELDHLGATWIDEHDSLPSSTQGKSLRLLDAMSFGTGPGLLGWLKAGAPEVIAFDTSDDSRIDPKESIKRRIGSFIAIPIQFADRPFGVLTAATHRTGGIDLREIDALRTLAGELSQAIARLQKQDSEGMVMPSEFKASLVGSEGYLIYLEPLKRKSLITEFGRPAYDRACRSFARKIRGRLPSNGMLCRRDDGSVMVFLRNENAKIAESWANEAAAFASMTSLTTPDGKMQIPFAIRAKTAMFGKHSDEFSPSLDVLEAGQANLRVTT